MFNLSESFHVALVAIWLNRARALLTMLGIIIGIGLVVAMVSLGRGVEDNIMSSFEGLGADQLTLSSSSPESETRTRIIPLKMADLDALSAYPSISDVGALNTLDVTVVGDGDNISSTARGVTANMDVIQDWGIGEGSYITQEHIDNRDRVVVLGVDVVEALYGDENYVPIGDIVKLDGLTFEVIGVMEPQGSGMSNDDNSVVIPISTLQTRLTNARIKGGYEVDTIYIQVEEDATTASATTEIQSYLYDEHDIASPAEEDYSIGDASDLIETVSSVTSMMTAFLAVIASISLLVGGIGIMNIMLVSVTERTREIGLRKAVGARPIDILTQFLMESLVISFLGGILGLVLAYVVTLGINEFVPSLTLSIQMDAVVIASVVSMLVGIIFGLLPANNAAQMNPIDALRFE